jgi:phenylacetate-CoA ligase
VEGRTADVLTFKAAQGGQMSIPALMFEIADTPGIEQFQIVQSSPTSLRLRLRFIAAADPERVWPSALDEIRKVLRDRNLDHVTVERAEEPPEQSTGGKYREIVPIG